MMRSIEAGTVLQGYRIDGLLSDVGNFSIVYLATDLDGERVARRRERIAGRLGRWRQRYGEAAAKTMIDAGPQVALKEFIPRIYGRRAASGAVAAAPEHADVFAWGRERFARESTFLAEHSHPNVVALFDRFALNNTEYYVMERLMGGSLGQRIARDGRQDEARIRRWLVPVLEGLASVERRDADHLDLSPANIMFRTPGGEPVLVDFGASRIGGAPPLHSSRFFVEDNFAAPEKYRVTSGKLDARTDIYSIGAIVAYALTGELPIQANERIAELRCDPGLSAAGQELLRRAAGRGFRAVVEHAFSCTADTRYADATTMLQALATGRREPPSPTAPGPALVRAHRQERARLLMFGALGLAALMLAVWGILNAFRGN